MADSPWVRRVRRAVDDIVHAGNAQIAEFLLGRKSVDSIERGKHAKRERAARRRLRALLRAKEER